MSTFGFFGNGGGNADGTFEVRVAGPVVLGIEKPTGDWTLKGTELNGRNLADDPIDVRHGETLNGIPWYLRTTHGKFRGVLLDQRESAGRENDRGGPEETSRWRAS